MGETVQLNTRIGDMDVDIFMQPAFVMRQGPLTSHFHAHQHVECHIIHRGFMEIQTEQQLLRLDAGHVCLLPKHLNHYIRQTSEDIIKCSFTIRLSKNKSKELTIFDEYNSVLDVKHVTDLLPTTFAFFERYHPAILSAALESSPISSYRLQALTTLLILDLYDMVKKCIPPQNLSSAIQIDAASQPETDEYLFHIETFMHKHYMEDISLKTLAAHVHLSPRQIERILKSHSGLSFGETLQQQRMWAAREHLANPHISISEVPYLVGFRSYSGFYSAIKKFWGATPNEMRLRLTTQIK